MILLFCGEYRSPFDHLLQSRKAQDKLLLRSIFLKSKKQDRL
jgi:hypothetical protein